jgi:hypothetical protein
MRNARPASWSNLPSQDAAPSPGHGVSSSWRTSPSIRMLGSTFCCCRTCLASKRRSECSHIRHEERDITGRLKEQWIPSARANPLCRNVPSLEHDPTSATPRSTRRARPAQADAAVGRIDRHSLCDWHPAPGEPSPCFQRIATSGLQHVPRKLKDRLPHGSLLRTSSPRAP